MPSTLQRLAILDDYLGVALSLAPWHELPPGIAIDTFRDHIADPEALAERLAPYDALVIMRERTPFPRSLIERLPNLKLLVTTGHRNLSVDMAACTERGITVCGTPGQVSPTAELTWGLILSLLRRIPEQDRALREGRWQTALGEGLEGATLGIIGLGKQGQRVARVARAFDMRVIAWSQNLTAEAAQAAGAQRVEKEVLLRQSDVVTLHLVLSARSRHTIGTAELALMKPTAYLVNTSRGPLVDTAALVDALRNRRIAGAALDVYDAEPLGPGHALADLPNSVLTPHLGYVSRQNFEIFYRGALEAIRAWLAGAPVHVIA